MKSLTIFALLFLILFALFGCTQADPTTIVQAYLQARVEANVGKLRSLSCADWEAQALEQAELFESIDASLQGVDCRIEGEDGAYTLVACDGKIVTTYNGESREWALTRYRTVQENGEWKMCGEAD